MERLEVVQMINNYINREDIELTNCSNCAFGINGISQPNAWEDPVTGMFDKESPNSGQAMKEAQESILKDFINIEEDETQIGDVITFRFNRSLVENYVRGDWEKDGRATDTEAFQAEVNRQWNKTGNAHYGVVLLKSKDGQNVIQMFEKSGKDPATISPYPPAPDAQFVPGASEGDINGKTPFYEKKDQ